jgi:RNA polymerase sigma-70 factor (ECF subfamily)
VSIDHVTDADLVARARQGDHAAFGELVVRHQTAVFRAALSAGASRADSEDVAQETFLLAYRRLESFRGEASFKTWLLTIAWNQSINHRRTLSKWLRRIVDVDTDDGNVFETLRAADPSGTPEELAAGNELTREIARAIRALPHKLRDALLLAQSGDYKYEEMGAMLKAPAGTIKWRVSEARRLVRQRLEARGMRRESR